MIATAVIPTCAALQAPTPRPADLEATVAAAEALVYKAQLYVAGIHAARAQAFTEEAHQALTEMHEKASTALRSDWEGSLAMVSLDLKVRRVVRLARDARREATTYCRQQARLELRAAITEGNRE